MLLTRAPLTYQQKLVRSFDLHVLSPPLAFVLSQDQTLQFKTSESEDSHALLTFLFKGSLKFERVTIQFSKTSPEGTAHSQGAHWACP